MSKKPGAVQVSPGGSASEAVASGVGSAGSECPTDAPAVADGETDPAALAALADRRLRATPDQLRDALGAVTALDPVYRQLLEMTLDELRLLEAQMTHLDQAMARLLALHQAAVQRLAEVPGLGVDSAQQIIAEVGATAATFPSPKQLASWVGACPGDEESAGVSHSHRSPKGNRQMRRLLPTRPPMPPSRRKGASSRSCIGDWSHAWAMPKRSGPLPTACVG